MPDSVQRLAVFVSILNASLKTHLPKSQIHSSRRSECLKDLHGHLGVYLKQREGQQGKVGCPRSDLQGDDGGI